MEILPNELYPAIFDHLHFVDLARLKQVSKKLRSLVMDYRIKDLEISSSDFSVDIFSNVENETFQNSRLLAIRPKNVKRLMPYRIVLCSPENSLFNPQLFLSLPCPQRLLELLDPRRPHDLSLPQFVREMPDPRRYLGLLGSPMHQLSVTDLFLRNQQFNFRFLKSLTCFCSEWPGTIRLNEVNKLVTLERLEITFINHINSFVSNYGQISLPNLKNLLLNYNGDRDFIIEVDAPKCEGFHLKESSLSSFERQCLLVKFRDPLSVKYLSLYKYSENSHVFKNIEFLQIVGASLIDQKFFTAFPHLQTLKFLYHNSLEGLKELFRWSKQGKRKVQLVFCGIPLVDGKELDAFQENDFGPMRELEYPPKPRFLRGMLENYEKLEDDLNVVGMMEFSEEISRLLVADVDRFIRKFHNMGFVFSSIKIERPELFLRLVSSCNSLHFLHIKNSGMNQQWFNQLGTIRTLINLKIEEETKINLSFISELPVLSSLKTNHEVDLREEVKLDKINRLMLQVKKNNLYVDIWKYPPSITEYEGKLYPFVLAVSKVENYRLSALDGPKMQHLEKFEDLLRLYEQIGNEAN